MSLLAALAATLLALGLIAFGVLWIGFQTVPAGYDAPDATILPETPAALPDSLPEAVRRFLHQRREDPLPRLDSAAVRGRGRLKLYGLLVPMRFRASYSADLGLHRVMEATWFGRPILRVEDRWQGGRGSRTLRGWQEAHLTGPDWDRLLERAFWTEAVWLPSVYATAAWTPASSRRCRLAAPALEARFHARTTRLLRLNATEPPPWSARFGAWRECQGIEVPFILWIHQGSRWRPELVLVAEGVQWGVPLSAPTAAPARQEEEEEA
jgi:hypothetical protein